MDTMIFEKVRNLTFWTSQVEPEPLGGGITNTNFVVADRGEKSVVRVGEDVSLMKNHCFPLISSHPNPSSALY